MRSAPGFGGAAGVDRCQSTTHLAVEQVAFQKNQIAIVGAVGTTAFTGKNRTSNEASWLQELSQQSGALPLCAGLIAGSG
jgi:hypothetical protein